MDKYAAMKTFQDTISVSMGQQGGQPMPTAERKLVFSTPNRFRVNTTTYGKPMFTVASNGTKLIEYAAVPNMPASSYTSPASIWTASDMIMQHPMFCGTLLYQFFGGSANYGNLVDTSKGEPTLGPESTVFGREKARTVQFYGQQQYGHVKALIGEDSGLVYRIEYDMEPITKEMASQGGKAYAMTTVESYSKAIVDKQIEDSVFAFTVPAGVTVSDGPSTGMGASDKPPIAVGSPAPDFTVTSLSGKPVHLADLKGQVVMIDFWATWCGPCREGLPVTAHIAQMSQGKGLRVLAISDEDAETVRQFVKKQSYQLDAYIDEGSKANNAYKVTGIPSTLIIGKDGKVCNYLVGLRDQDTILKALSDAGVKL
jgi:cytochrome c biogenesis protein CcmG/thiol:disulfide interchange protein DsbE